MDTYTIIYVEDGYWTVLDVTSGVDMRAAHQFADKAEAEQMAAIMNGKLSGELAS
jgi:hypothetical protein